MICPNCGKNVSVNQEFCPYCGVQTQFSSKIRYFPKEVPTSGAQKTVLQPTFRQEDVLREKEREKERERNREIIRERDRAIASHKNTIAKQKRLIVLLAVIAAVALLAACALGCLYMLKTCAGSKPADDPIPEEIATVPPTDEPENPETPAPSEGPNVSESPDASETGSPAPESTAPVSESPAPTEEDVETAETNPTEMPLVLRIKDGETSEFIEAYKDEDCLRVDLYLDGLGEKDLLSSMTFTLLYNKEQVGYKGRIEKGPFWNAADDGWIVADGEDGEIICTFYETKGKSFGKDEPILTLYFAMKESVTEGTEIAVTIADAIEAKVLREGSEAPEDCKVKADTEPFIFAAKE